MSAGQAGQPASESRADVMGAHNLFELLCERTARDYRARTQADSPTTLPAAGVAVLAVAAAGMWLFGPTTFTNVLVALLIASIAWTIWSVVIRSSARVAEKADDIRRGRFTPEVGPMLLARLRWWGHLIAPLRWARHSRLHDRRFRLERRVEEIQAALAAAAAATAADSSPAPTAPPDPAMVKTLADSLQTAMDRTKREQEIKALSDPTMRLREGWLLCLALRVKVDEMMDKLERLEKLTFLFHEVGPENLGLVVSEAVGVLEERRQLVLEIDQSDPEAFIDLVTATPIN